MNSLLRLIPFLKPFTPYIVTAVILAIPLAAIRGAPAKVLEILVNDLGVSKDPDKLIFYPLLFIGLFAVNFIVRFIHYYCIRVVVGRVNQKLKNDLFEHLLGLSADHFTKQSTGTLISRVGADTQYIDGGIAAAFGLIREPVTFLGLLAYALYVNWWLTLVTLIIFPPLAWLFSATGKNLKRYIQKMAEENAKLYSTLQESFTGIRVVKMFRLEKYVRKKFRDQAQNFVDLLLKTAKLEEAAHPMVELLSSFAIAAVIYIGGSQVMQGKMTQGELFGFFAAFALMMNPIRQINDANLKLNAAASACKRLFEAFDWKSNLVQSSAPKTIKAFERELEFKNVRFAYPDTPSREVLKGITFTLTKGQVLALVGHSGAGKSSLVHLIPRVFDVTGGSIHFDGQDLRECSLEDLRKLIAVVSQDVFLFNDTIEENIRCGRLSATSEEIREAAKRANALEFIERMPDGFKTNIGDRGQKLSGGEKQRLSIARAFLRDAPLLILDEATSSLDSENERAIQDALEKLMKNKTTLVIAHRLSTIKNAHQILVMREGEIVERGTHRELSTSGGEYARSLATAEVRS